jgi:hypothetical protein
MINYKLGETGVIHEPSISCLSVPNPNHKMHVMGWSKTSPHIFIESMGRSIINFEEWESQHSLVAPLIIIVVIGVAHANRRLVLM